MKSFFTTLLLVFAAVMTCFAGNKTKTFQIGSPCTAIKVSANIEVSYSAGASYSMKATAAAEVIDLMTVKITDGVLELNCPNPDNIKNTTVKVTLTAPSFSKIDLAGNASFTALQPYTADRFELILLGNASFKTPAVNVSVLDILGGGNGVARLGDVVCSEAKFSFAGNSVLRASALTCNTLQLSASGNSTANVKTVAATSAELAAIGNSEIELDGRISVVNYHASGNSEIEARGLAVNGGSLTASGNATIVCHVADLVSETNGNARVINK